MCGIVGIVSDDPILDRLLEGLEKLQYRGYDSSGVAIFEDHGIHVVKAAGKLEILKSRLSSQSLKGGVGIAHTRWATHGSATDQNAHPHSHRSVAVVHNGIIENYAVLKESLETRGVSFVSQTDTEVVVHLMEQACQEVSDPFLAFRRVVSQLEGVFSLVLMTNQAPEALFFIKQGSPLVLGKKSKEAFVASDVLALGEWSDTVLYLNDGEYGIMSSQGISLYNAAHDPLDRAFSPPPPHSLAITKGHFPHFMRKEMEEQPSILSQIFSADHEKDWESLSWVSWATIPKLSIVACGTSYYAGMIAKYWLESYARLPVEVDLASEFRYREGVFVEGGVCLFISQSGETLDTLKALELAKAHHQMTLAIVNVPTSSLARQAHGVIELKAGIEIGVASTKAMIAQLARLAQLTQHVAQAKTLSFPSSLLKDLQESSVKAQQILSQEADYRQSAASFLSSRHLLFLGRGTSFPVALEGALKMKELSYIHAEGYAAGELKHGPIALLDPQMPVVAVMPFDAWFPKTLSNIQEVLARQATLICLTDSRGLQELKSHGIHPHQRLILPDSGPLTSPLLSIIALQLLAYHTAVLKGTDVDQPRNLAKSVTVE